MAYRNPAFLPTNRVAVAGASAISVLTGAAFAAANPKERLIDGRISRNAKAASAGAWEIGVDLGSSISCNRVVVPVGHNLSGATVQVYTYTAFGPPTGSVQRASVVAGAGAIDISFAAVASRYWSLYVPTVTLAWELPEWILGTYAQTSTGVVSTWGVSIEEPVLVAPFPTREATVLEAAARRTLSLGHRALAGADLAIYDDVIALGRSRAFLHWPVDDSLASPLLVKLEGRPTRDQDSPNPRGTGPTYRVELEMLEQAT